MQSNYITTTHTTSPLQVGGGGGVVGWYQLQEKQPYFWTGKFLLSKESKSRQGKVSLLLKKLLPSKKTYSLQELLPYDSGRSAYNLSWKQKSKQALKKLFLLFSFFLRVGKRSFFSEKVFKIRNLLQTGFHVQAGIETGSARWICSRVNRKADRLNQ